MTNRGAGCGRCDLLPGFLATNAGLSPSGAERYCSNKKPVDL